MTANRTAPTLSNTPGGIDGEAYALRVAEEIAALYEGRVNQVSSVGGSANAITGVCTPPLTGAPSHGATFRLKPTAGNSSAVTINLDGVGVIDLRDEDDAALSSGDIVTGRSIEFWYDASVGRFKLGNASLQSIIDTVTAAVAGDDIWELIGDTTISTAVATVEHLFSANSYQQIKMLASGLSGSAGSNTLNISLRYASGIVVNAATGAGAIGAADRHTIEATMNIDVNTSNATCYINIRGATNSGTITAVEAAATGSNIADRVRVNYTSGNIDAGRITIWGLKTP